MVCQFTVRLLTVVLVWFSGSFLVFSISVESRGYPFIENVNIATV